MGGEHDSWLSGIGIDVSKIKGAVEGVLGVTDLSFTVEFPDLKNDKLKFGDESVVKGALKLQGEISGELTKLGAENSNKAGVTSNVGVKNEKELAQQKCTKMIGNCKIKDIKESANFEGSKKKFKLSISVEATLEFGEAWLKGVVTGELKAAEIEWKELIAKGEYTVAGIEIDGGVTGEGEIEINENYKAKLKPKIVIAGTIEPNWPVIIEKAIEKYGEDVVAEAGVTASLVLVAIATIAGTANELSKAVDEAQLNAQIDFCRESFNTGIKIAIRGDPQPGDGWQAAGWKVGRRVFDEVMKQVTAKNPDGDPDEIREGAIKWLNSPSNRAKNIDSAEVQARIQHLIGGGFWSRWVDANHGVGTFLGDARRVCGRCFGKTLVAENDPDLDEWKKKSSLPEFMK